jgi:hypothetical protein
MQHVSDPMTPYSGSPSDTDVSLSIRCQSCNSEGIGSPSFTGRSEAFANAADDHVKTGGAYRDRTDDLLNANQALSQLS